MAKGRKKVSRAVWQASHSVWPSAAHALRRMAGRASVVLRRLESPGIRAPVRRVIFVCTHNAGRSQMAAAFFNQLADPTRARAIAAGTRGARSVDPMVLAAMRETGLDLGESLARRLSVHLAMAGSHVVTMDCAEDVPFLAGVSVRDWPIEDPRGQSADRVREIRDEIRSRVEEMIARQGWARPAPAA
jgi:arsenate reductase